MKHPPDHEETERHALRTVLQQRGHVLVSLGEDRRIVEDHREQVHLTDVVIEPEKNGKETPVWGVAQFGEMSYSGSQTRVGSG